MTDKQKKMLKIVSVTISLVLIALIIICIFTCTGKNSSKNLSNEKNGAELPIERNVSESEIIAGEVIVNESDNVINNDDLNIDSEVKIENEIDTKIENLDNNNIEENDKKSIEENKNNTTDNEKNKSAYNKKNKEKYNKPSIKKENKNKPVLKDELSSELEKLFIEFEKTDLDSERNVIINKALPLAKKAVSQNKKSSEAHFFMAQDFINKSDFSKATGELNRAISFGENYLYYYYLGKMLYLRGDFNGAIKAFKKSCELNMHFAPSRYNLGLSYSKVNKIDQALSSYKQAISVKPNYEQAYLGIGRLYKQVKFYDDAITAYNKVIEINNENVSARMDLGVIYNEKGDYPKAIQVFKEALKYSDFGDIQTVIKYNLSIALYNNGNYEEALKISKESYEEKFFVTDSIEESNLIYNYGLILETCGLIQEAIDIYKEALVINKNHLKAKINLSNLYMKQENPDADEVLRLLNEAYVVAPYNFEVNNNMGNAYVLKGDYKNAVIYLKNALDSHPDDNIVKQNLASSFLKAEDYKNAEKVYLEIIEDNKENWQAYLDIAKVYIQLNDDEKAMYYLVYLQSNKQDFKTEEVNKLLSALKI